VGGSYSYFKRGYDVTVDLSFSRASRSTPVSYQLVLRCGANSAITVSFWLEIFSRYSSAEKDFLEPSRHAPNR